MDTSSSSAAALTRPRLAILTGLAATSVVLYFAEQYYLSWRHPSTGLHRSNAIRRSRHRSHAVEDAHAIADRRDSASSDPASQESHADENAHHNIDGDMQAIEEQTMDDDWANDTWGPPPQRAGQNIVGLLFRVSEDNARRNAYIHRGCMCNACGAVPIRGIRYRCANCSDFDLCETCESQGLHNKTHVFYKVRIPAPPFGPKSMQPVWYPGDPDTCLRNLPRALMAELSKETGFERPELEAFWEQWTFIASTEWRDDPDELYLAMDRKTFERCLIPSGGHRRTAPNLIHDRMFAFYDANDDDLISFREFLEGLSYRKRKDKLRRIFKGYDVDGDGYVTRKDFLRIFRAYYVLYKHMHRDILEGLDVQVMNSTDTHQLATSRQPLSSQFGREGRVPEADHGRPMEGKAFHGTGDVVVIDGKEGAVSEDRGDTGDRGEILSSLFNRRGADSLWVDSPYSPASEHVQSPNGDDVAQIYHDALLDPPTDVSELPSLLVGEARNDRPEESANLLQGDEAHHLHQNSGSSDEEGSSAHSPAAREDATSPGDQDAQNPTHGDAALGEASTRQPGNEQWTSRVPTESQLRARVVAHKERQALNRRYRVAARKKLFERWKKRQFYLGEEEGTTPPEGFPADDDILSRANADAEGSKAERIPLSVRSRSSSKVRFAEDTDDYEIRSNPSTSSRSVPERWGGMDIPDAERDVGKEILYTVTQQAFNELLDVLFKKKEDEALRVAETKEIREKHRPLWENLNIYEELDWPHDQTRIHDPVLNELLVSAGYTVDGPSNASFADAGDAEEAVLAEVVEEERPRRDPFEDEDGDGPEHAITIVYPSGNDTPHPDPTMPQFRPNSDRDLEYTPTIPVPVASDSEPDESPSSQAPAKTSASKTSSEKANPEDDSDKSLPEDIPRATLVEWKKLDMMEGEAKVRGGWGRLDFQEFKEIWRKEESGPQRLEYLGTWIDFCIP